MAERRIVPADAALVLGGVVVGGLVEELGLVGEDQEAVGEALRDPELPLVLGGEHLAQPAPAGRRAAPQVDGHVEDLAADHPHQLPLRLRQLVVEAAQHAARREAVVVLHEAERPAQGRLQLALVVALEEEAPGVAEDLRLDHHDAGQGGRAGPSSEHPGRRAGRAGTAP